MNDQSWMITGGSGAFGTAAIRILLARPSVTRLVCFSRSEARQADLRRTIIDSRCRWLIGDIRDKDRLVRAMHGVNVVLHAAALKRIEACEYDSSECAKTNILGTMNVVEAAALAGVSKVVTLSSDKGSAPIGMYGASKLAAERLTLAAQTSRGATGPLYSTTRYGNVAGSTGSVIPVWRGAGPFRLSDPEVTRFWMSLPEAVGLVLWTVQHMRGGETVIPKLPAYRLGDLAEAMGISPTVTGSGAFEKKHETMISPEEAPEFVDLGSHCIRGGGWEGVRLDGPLSSETARRMSVEEIRRRLEEVQ